MIHNDQTKTSSWRLWANGALMAGREFCYSLEIVSVTPVMKLLGLDDEATSLIWISSPILGLLIGPFIGSFSDRCQARLGRRRPFLIFLCLCAMLGMTLLTFAPYMTSALGSTHSALVIAIVGSQMMDWGLDATETPFRAYTLDCVPQSDQTSAFNIQTFLTGLGGGFGFAMAGAFGIGKREELFYIAIVFITITLALTLFSFKERQFKRRKVIDPTSPSKEDIPQLQPSASGARRKPKKIRFEDNLRSFNQRNPTSAKSASRKAQSEAVLRQTQHRTYPKQISLARGFAMTTTRWASDLYKLTDSSSMPAGLDKDDWSDSDYDLTEDEESTDSSLSNRIDGFLQLQAPLDKVDDDNEITTTISTPCLKQPSQAKLDSNANNIIVDAQFEKRKKKKKQPEMLMEPIITPRNIIKSFTSIPTELRMLCLVDLCTWAALCTFLIYYTDVFGEYVYAGDPEAPANSTEFKQYEAGFKMGCYGLVEYSICMSLGSAIIERFDLYERFPVKYFYAAAYGIVTMCCCVMFAYPNVVTIMSLTWLIGMAISVLYTVPLILLAKYHQSSSYVRKSLPGTKRSYGLDCAILVSQNYCGQLAMSIVVGPLIKTFSSNVIIFLITAVFSSFGFILASFFVHYSVPP